MTQLDDDLRAGVKEALQEVGATVVLMTSASAGEYDATTGMVVYTPVAYTVLCTPPGPFNEEQLKGEGGGGSEDIIRKGDMTTLLSALLLDEASTPVPDPVPGWTLTIRAKVWQVLVVAPVMSGDEVCAWTLKLGR